MQGERERERERERDHPWAPSQDMMSSDYVWAHTESQFTSVEKDRFRASSTAHAHSHADSGAFYPPTELQDDQHTITARDEICNSQHHCPWTTCMQAVGLDNTQPQLQSVHGSRPKTKTIVVPHPNSMKLAALDAIAIYHWKFNKTPVGLLKPATSTKCLPRLCVTFGRTKHGVQPLATSPTRYATIPREPVSKLVLRVPSYLPHLRTVLNCADFCLHACRALSP